MDSTCDQTCTVCGLVPLVTRLKGTTTVIARSPSMQALLKRAARFAASDAPVVVLGETGTGKEVVARVLHANSARAKQPFVPVNVAALPADLLESELFGHGRGAFTGASAAQPGLFEAAQRRHALPRRDRRDAAQLPGEAPARAAGRRGAPRRRERLLRRRRARGLRHAPRPRRARARGLFREDLYYRLRVLTLEVPPLRERRDDVLALALHFLGEEKTARRGFTASAKAKLLGHSWPGNVRELQNVVKHGAALATGVDVDEGDLPETLSRPAASLAASPGPQALKTLAEVEREHILRVLDSCGGSQSEAARVLGVARNTLWRKLRSLS